MKRTMLRVAVTLLAGLVLAALVAAQVPLPEMRVEATDGGSVLHIKNTYSQPLTAFLVELVDYPGSSFSLWHEGYVSHAIEPGMETGIPVTNMTVGAAPEYVKLRAAIYADGSTAGIPEKVEALLARRRAVRGSLGKLIATLEKAVAAKTPAKELIASLMASREEIPEATRRKRNTPEAIANEVLRGGLLRVSKLLEQSSTETVLANLKRQQSDLAASKPLLGE